VHILVKLCYVVQHTTVLIISYPSALTTVHAVIYWRKKEENGTILHTHDQKLKMAWLKNAMLRQPIFVNTGVVYCLLVRLRKVSLHNALRKLTNLFLKDATTTICKDIWHKKNKTVTKNLWLGR